MSESYGPGFDTVNEFPRGTRIRVKRMTSIFLPGDRGTVVGVEEQRGLVRVRFDSFTSLMPQRVSVDDIERDE